MRAIGRFLVVACLGMGSFAGCGSESETKPSDGSDAGEAGEGGTSTGGTASGGRGGGGSSSGGTGTGGRGGSSEGGAGGEIAMGQALRFDGDGDILTLPAASGAANEAAYSIELWFRTSAATGMLFEVFGSGADRSLYVSAGRVCFYVNNAPSLNEICTTADTYDDGAWHHAAGTLGSSGGQNLYVDGLAIASTTATASAFAADIGFRAGYGYIGPNGPLTYFAGDIDEIRVWSVERSLAAIAANRSQSIDPETSGLQGYWQLDETGTSSTANDASPGAHDGTLTGFSLSPSPWVSPGAI